MICRKCEENGKDDALKEIVASTHSLGYYEDNTYHAALPQVSVIAM
jgi:hypothetical protein